MNVSYLLKYLWSKKWLVIIPTLITIIIAWQFTRNLRPEYTSVAELSTGYMDENPIDNAPKTNKEILFNNVIQTLASNQVLDLVSYKLLLHDLQEKSPFRKIENKSSIDKIIQQFPGGRTGLIQTLERKIDSSSVLNLAINNDRSIRKLATLYQYSPDALLQQVQIQKIQGSDFIKIVATTNDPQLSSTVSNEVCQQFLTLYQNSQGKASVTSLDTLKSLVDAKKEVLDNKLALLGSTDNASTETSTSLLSTLRNQLIQQKGNLIAANVALESVNKQIGNIEKDNGLTNNSEIIILRNNIDSLYAKYVNRGSSDQSLLAQIDKLRNQLQSKLSTVSRRAGVSPGDLFIQKSDLEIKINAATQTMNDLQDKINALEGSFQSASAQQGVLQGLQSEIEVARQQYLDANALYNNTLNHTLFPGNNFKQVLHASPPIYSNPSKKTKIIGFAGAGIFFALIFIVLFIEFIDPSIKTPGYLKENIPFPLLASLRNTAGKSSLKRLKSIDTSGISTSSDGYNEEIKQLRYNIEKSGKRIFLFAGYHPRSGRTSIIEAVASSLSLINRKTLIIDANFRNNTLTKKYGVEPNLGTINLSKDSLKNENNVISNATPVIGNNIKLIGCDAGNITPEELLPKENIFTWINQNNNGFDYILVDCAALKQGPDCKELLKYIDSLIMVFAANQPLTEGDRQFSDFLNKEQIHVIGTVLNRVNTYSIDT